MCEDTEMEIKTEILTPFIVKEGSCDYWRINGIETSDFIDAWEQLQKMLSGKLMDTPMVRCFYNLLKLMAEDNAFILKDFENIDWPDQYNWNWYGNSASQISITDHRTFMQGEESDRSDLVELHGLQELDAMMNMIFDGVLHEVFFSPGFMRGNWPVRPPDMPISDSKRRA